MISSVLVGHNESNTWEQNLLTSCSGVGCSPRRSRKALRGFNHLHPVVASLSSGCPDVDILPPSQQPPNLWPNLLAFWASAAVGSARKSVGVICNALTAYKF